MPARKAFFVHSGDMAGSSLRSLFRVPHRCCSKVFGPRLSPTEADEPPLLCLSGICMLMPLPIAPFGTRNAWQDECKWCSSMVIPQELVVAATLAGMLPICRHSPIRRELDAIARHHPSGIWAGTSASCERRHPSPRGCAPAGIRTWPPHYLCRRPLPCHVSASQTLRYP